MKTHGILSSMSGVGNCYDNAVAESFFGLLKWERVRRRNYRTQAEARTDIFNYIERFYNQQRRHSYSKGLAPGGYAQQISETLNSPVHETGGRPLVTDEFKIKSKKSNAELNSGRYIKAWV
ncbi:MAG: IS3 family transposase, partial [Nitrospirales bacterium]|nr:IS3 family transposase [Nitrospirales bacterium]